MGYPLFKSQMGPYTPNPIPRTPNPEPYTLTPNQKDCGLCIRLGFAGNPEILGPCQRSVIHTVRKDEFDEGKQEGI